MNEIIELIKTGKNDLLEAKLEENPSIAKSYTDQGVSLLQFSAYCKNSRAIEILKKYRTEVDIFEAVSIGHIQTIMQELTKKSGIINSYSADGFTLLGLASYFGHFSIVKLLLENGANPNIPSNNQFKVTPLHSACAISHFEIAELLIDYKADVNAKQMQEISPLHSASHNGQTKLVKLLIDNGAVINAKTESGQTPLFMAKEKKYIETVELISNHGGI
jgi:uncharacterized protein